MQRQIERIGRSTSRAAVLAGAMAGMLSTGCRQDMHDQPKFYPQRGTTFFVDGRSSRPQVENTVARTQLHADSYFYTGLDGGKEGNALPFPATIAVLERGQERYNTYCTPCHSRVGNGAGMIVQRGYHQAGNFHTARLEAAPLGHFFNVISNGYGAMPDYASQVTVEDRWAIVAYIKALQLSQRAGQADVANGSHVEPLTDIEEREGFAPEFAKEWSLPPTAVTGTNTGDVYVIPPGTEVPASMKGSGNSPMTSTPGNPGPSSGNPAPRPPSGPSAANPIQP